MVEYLTGRVKTPLVFQAGDSGPAVIAEVIARPCQGECPSPLRVIGPVEVAPATQEHLQAVILPLAESILAHLGIAPCPIELSITNLGAAATMDVGMSVGGFSADLAVFVAILSARLGLPVPQAVALTGHVSPAGDVRPVKSIPSKLAAATADPDLSRFLCPDPNADASLETLAPEEKRRIDGAIDGAKRRIEIVTIKDVAQVVKAIFPNEAIVLASLRADFYNKPISPQTDSTIVGKAACLLLRGNPEKFWTALEHRLLEGHNVEIRQLLQAFIDYHLRQGIYPSGFGERLYRLLLAVPPATRRLKIEFSLLTRGQWLQLGQLATEFDADDVRLLFDASEGRINHEKSFQHEAALPAGETKKGEGDATLDAILWAIDETTLSRKISLPLDQARASYPIASVTLDSYDDTIQLYSSFYLHLAAHTQLLPAPIDSQAAGPEALALLERAMERRGGYNAAVIEAKEGLRGGVPKIIDLMVEQAKSEARRRYLNKVFREALDPLDWPGRVALMRALLERIKPCLPPDFELGPPEQYAAYDYEPLIEAYLRSFESVRNLLRTL